MSGDDKPRALPVPAAIDHVSGGRGGPEERVVESVKRSINDARARVTATVAADDTAETVERRRLISEIRTMRRYRVNMAFEGMVTGAIYTGGVWALLRLGRWIFDELRSPPKPPPAPQPQTTQQPTSQQSTSRLP